MSRLGSRFIVAIAVAAATRAPSAARLPQQLPRYTERVDVTRVLVDARVLDSDGRPMPGLEPDDFLVKIDGRAARVESALWIAGGAVDREGAPIPATAIAGSVEPLPPGRLIVFLFQKDLEPSRIVGLMRLLIETRKFVDGFGSADRVAVVSFDYHLKVWVDFTNDFDEVRRILERGILFRNPGAAEPAGVPSLVERLSQAKGRKTYSMEKALLAIADALEPLPGAKSLVLVGHGWGRLSGSGLFFDREFGPAVEAFQAGRVTVFTLDTTEADYHTLEAGLQVVAEQTGGFYARTHLFTGQAMERLAGALEGHYVLFVEKPFGQRGYHRIEVELVGRKGTVMAKSGFVG
jgi:VWFA-related protein